MQQNFEGMNVLFGHAGSLEEMKKLPVKRVFDDRVCAFLSGLSAEIRKDVQAKGYPDLIALSFFIRRTNIEKLKQEYAKADRIGRGLSFHVAPSNVPVIFAYTLAAGLLAGNACIVRVSSKNFAQTEILCRLMKKTEAYAGLEQYIAVVQYERNKKINDRLSANADIRIIWGGDNTVREIRKSTVPPRCVDVAFADRYSICVLDAESVRKAENLEYAAQAFYNDTYQFDQNACSSPRLIYWIGTDSDVETAKKRFWNAVHVYAGDRYEIKPMTAVDKLMTDCRAAIELDQVKIETDAGNLIHRIKIPALTKEIIRYACPGGSFLEYESGSLDDLEKVIDNKYQTLAYFGCSAKRITQWVLERGLHGIDRIVPVGKTGEFSLTWDGYDLIEALSRKIAGKV